MHGTYRQTPVYGEQEFTLKTCEFERRNAADASVMRIGAESVAKGFGRESDGSDDESVAGERRDGEVGQAGADLVYVVHHDEDACLLQAQEMSARDTRAKMRHEVYLAIRVTHDAAQVIQDANLRHRCRMEASHALSGQEVSKNWVNASYDTHGDRGI